MYYTVGQHVDLTHLNKKVEVAKATPKSQVQDAIQTASTLYEVGASYVWDKATGRLTRRIQVQFA